MGQAKRHFKNIEGDFYVEDGCCTACGIPDEYAPGLMSYAEDGHCYFSKQPENNSELYKAIKAVWASEVQCLRYGGEDRAILRRLAEADAGETCDRIDLIADAAPVIRNHVTFAGEHIQRVNDIANAFYAYLKDTSEWNKQLVLSAIKDDGGALNFSYSWYDNECYPIWFEAAGTGWHIFHARNGESAASRSISIRIDEWLRLDSQFDDIRWFTESAWNTARYDWSPTAV